MIKNLKFVSGADNQREFAAELRKVVNHYFKQNNLSTKGNLYMWIKTIILVGLYLAPFIVIVTVSMNAWLALLLVIIMGIGEAGVGMSVMHDAAHGAYSKHK